MRREAAPHESFNYLCAAQGVLGVVLCVLAGVVTGCARRLAARGTDLRGAIDTGVGWWEPEPSRVVRQPATRAHLATSHFKIRRDAALYSASIFNYCLD